MTRHGRMVRSRTALSATETTTTGNARRTRGRFINRPVDGFASIRSANNDMIIYYYDDIRCTAVYCIIIIIIIIMLLVAK